jgi:hypothetical protein
MTPPLYGRPGEAAPAPARRSRPVAAPRRLAAALAVLVAVAACSHQAPTPTPAPVRTAAGPELAIYRTVAESIYVRTTKRSVGVVTAPLDTVCGANQCRPLLTRWGLDPLWWATGDSSAARTARQDLLAGITHPMSLADVSTGQPLLQSVAPDSAALVAAQPDTAHWTTFKEAHGGAAGFVRFSPIGFDAARHSAIVFVDWQCGPFCGHTVAIALSDSATGVWRIDDMLLLSSRTPNGVTGTRQ